MALISCSECGNEVSDKAAACPKCGCPVSVSVPAVVAPAAAIAPAVGSAPAVRAEQAIDSAPDSPRDGYSPILPAKRFRWQYFALGLGLLKGAHKFAEAPDVPGAVVWACVLGALYVLGTKVYASPGKLEYCKKCQMQTVAKRADYYSAWKCERCDAKA